MNPGNVLPGTRFDWSLPVSQLNDIKLLIEAKIRTDKLDANDIRGRIGLKSGKLLAFINENTPDDPDAIAKLKRAAKEVLNLAA
jgi:hypothetical protein